MNDPSFHAPTLASDPASPALEAKFNQYSWVIMTSQHFSWSYGSFNAFQPTSQETQWLGVFDRSQDSCAALLIPAYTVLLLPVSLVGWGHWRFDKRGVVTWGAKLARSWVRELCKAFLQSDCPAANLKEFRNKKCSDPPEGAALREPVSGSATSYRLTSPSGASLSSLTSNSRIMIGKDTLFMKIKWRNKCNGISKIYR